MIRLFGTVVFRSKLQIIESAELISDVLLGGVPFGGLHDYIYDELPAVYSDGLILGHRFILSGGEGVYTLDIDIHQSAIDVAEKSGFTFTPCDLSLHFAQLLSTVPGVEVVDPPLQTGSESVPK